MSMSEWRASWSSMWSKKPTPVAILAAPDAVEVDFDLDLGLVGLAGDRALAHVRLRSPKVWAAISKTRAARPAAQDGGGQGRISAERIAS